MDSADDAICGAALDGAILSWNKGAERMYGYRAEEILGNPLSMLAPVGGIGETSQLLARIGGEKPSRKWRRSRWTATAAKSRSR